MVIGTAAQVLSTSTALWALAISVLSFALAAAALLWQISKHFLDGGRVKVHLNAAAWEEDFALWNTSSGKAVLDESIAHQVTRGQAIELAQLVVENPGRAAVTIHSPGLRVRGLAKRRYSFVPRLFTTGDGFGANTAVADDVVRLEPYGRVTFLMDYWSSVPGLVEKSPRGRISVRGQVGVAGRSRPQQSRWRRRWMFDKNSYTALAGNPLYPVRRDLARAVHPATFVRGDGEGGEVPHGWAVDESRDGGLRARRGDVEVRCAS